MKIVKLLLGVSVLLLGFVSCTGHKEGNVPDSARSVYYWKTVFKLDNAEMNFLKNRAVKKIYLRYFDVDYNEQGVPVPVGTLQFDSKIPQGIRVIPVVYIENHCLEKAGGLAEKIVKRVQAMSKANDIEADELQLDCDWTLRSRSVYFDLLSHVRKLLNEERNCRISATIRLHQLGQPAPPVDYGVLMCYNTGNLRDFQTENSILDIKDVRPFVRRYLEKYPLPLCAAYPVFSWKLLFENGQFRAILRDVDLSDSSRYRKISANRYIVLRSHSVPIPDPNSFGLMVRAGDEIKVDEVSARTIREVQSVLEGKRPLIDRQVILFSLNSINNNKFTPYEMDQIYSH